MHDDYPISVMSENKQRLTITVDPHLIEAGQRAVEAGLADSVSSWINEAIEHKVAHDLKLEFLASAIADFEAEHGEITVEEVTAQRRADRAKATVVRGSAKSA